MYKRIAFLSHTVHSAHVLRIYIQSHEKVL